MRGRGAQTEKRWVLAEGVAVQAAKLFGSAALAALPMISPLDETLDLLRSDADAAH